MAAQQQVVRVKVPQGATVGSTVQATLPNGQQVKVQLPPGVVPGQVISIAVQAAASPRTTQNLPPQAASNVQAMKAVRLTVPATIPASRTIRFTLDGTVHEVPLPPGARPGQTLDLQVPAAAPQPVKKKSSSWFGSKTKKKSGKKPEAAPPPPGTRRVRVVVPPNLGSATSFGISVDGVSMVVNVPKGVKAGESVNVDVPLPTGPAREVATAPAPSPAAPAPAPAPGGGWFGSSEPAPAPAPKRGWFASLTGRDRPAGEDAPPPSALKRHAETSSVVQNGMTVASALLSAGSSLPLVGRLCEAAQSCLGSAEEFSEKADDVLVAAKRVVDVLNVVQMMARNADKLAEGRELVEQAMRELVDLVVEFDGAVRKFGKKGWLQRAFKMQSHTKSLGRLDKRIVAQLQIFRDIYRLSVDHLMMERTYRIEASVGQLVAERVRATGESEAQAAASLSADPAAVARVAVDGRVAAAELSSELQEFRLEVKEGLDNLDKKMQQMLAGRDGDRDELAGIAKAVNAAAARDAELMKAVEAGAARDEQILAAVEAGAQRDAGLRQQIRGLGDSLRRKTKKESARQYKDAQLERYEVQVEDVSEAPIATGGFGSVHTAWYAAEEVCLKKISIAGLTHARREKVVRSFKTELGIMTQLRSPRIVSVLGVVTTDSSCLGLVMEYCVGGSLRAALDDESGVVTGALQRTWSADVALGMSYLYAQGVEHRDLKALNVLLTSDLRGKVTDFGLSRCDELKTALTTQATAGGGGAAGTPAFMAPELLEDNVFDEKSDVYSYAMVLWEIWDKGLPWHGLQPMQIMRKVVDKRQRPPVPAGMPAELRVLMVRAWAPDPADRPDFAGISSRLKAFSPRTRAAARPPASSAQNSTRSLANPRSWLGGAS